MNRQQLTHKTHVIADHKGLPFNVVLTHYFLEIILARIAASPVSKHFVFKGGFLLANILGIESRSTIDIDVLLNGVDMSESTIKTLVNQVLIQPVNPEVLCELQSVKPIRGDDPYGGFRVRILCRLDNIRQIVPLDLATGDPITPNAIHYEYHPLYPGKPIKLASYNLETLIAEKIETVYRRGFANSRCKDFYDVHIIWKTKREQIKFNVLRDAFANTCSHRVTQVDQHDFMTLLAILSGDDQMEKRWKAFVNRNLYAKEIPFSDTLNSIREIISILLA
jgi:hypothetical protein